MTTAPMRNNPALYLHLIILSSQIQENTLTNKPQIKSNTRENPNNEPSRSRLAGGNPEIHQPPW